MSAGVSAQQLILSTYIKYNRLKDLCNVVFGSIPPEELKVVDIYIDLYSLLDPLYRGSYEPALDPSNNMIAAGILNMVAHYRAFFRNYGIDTRFFFVHSANYSTSKAMLVPEYGYNAHCMLNDISNKLVMDNLSLVDRICRYINNTALTASVSTDVAVLIYDIIGRENSGNYNIIITKDVVVNQVAAICPKTIIFTPKKYKGEDVSCFISPLNGGLYNNLAKVFNNKYEDPGLVSPGFYSFVLAATKVTTRGLKQILSLKKIMGELERIIQFPDVLNGYNTDINIICDKLDPKINATLQHNNIIGRYKVIDAIQGYASYCNQPEYKLYSGIQNLYDPGGLHQLDTEFFSEWHLDLERM